MFNFFGVARWQQYNFQFKFKDACLKLGKHSPGIIDLFALMSMSIILFCVSNKIPRTLFSCVVDSHSVYVFDSMALPMRPALLRLLNEYQVARKYK